MGVEEEVAVEGGAVTLVSRVHGAALVLLFSDVARFQGSSFLLLYLFQTSNCAKSTLKKMHEMYTSRAFFPVCREVLLWISTEFARTWPVCLGSR